MTMTEANPVWLGITNVGVLAVAASNYVASIETGQCVCAQSAGNLHV
jgi:hypothetical protein